MNLAGMLSRMGRSYSGAPALTYDGKTRSYGEFDRRVSRLAGGLRELGMDPGDRVGIFQLDHPDLLESLFAIFRAGLIAVPINRRLHPDEVSFVVRDCGVRALIHSSDLGETARQVRQNVGNLTLVETGDPGDSKSVPSYEELVDSGQPIDDRTVEDEDPAWIFYTSGTTGRPKGAVLTHRNLWAMTSNYFVDIERVEPGDVLLHAAPLTHGSGLWALPGVAGGGHHVIAHGQSFEPARCLDLVEEYGVDNFVFLAPTQIRRLVDARTGVRDLSSLTTLGWGGAPMHAETVNRAVDTFGPIFVQLYGLGECPMTITVLRKKDHVSDGSDRAEERLTSAGIPRLGMDVQVVDENHDPVPPGEEGEVVARGPVVMKEYWNRPEETERVFQDGWFSTGDIGTFDEEGYLYLLDRVKDVIISGGANIYPREVEEVILQHDRVRQVSVIGVPDEEWGEAVKAVVVATEEDPDEGELERSIIELCSKRIAGYKKPKSVDVVESLPTNAYGKILKRELRDRYWDDRDRSI